MTKVSVYSFRKALVFFSKALIATATLLAFLFVLTEYYPSALFYYKGNIILAFLYFLVFFIYATTYGCFKIGILRLRELIFSYVLAVTLTNFITYIMLSLISETMLNPLPLLALCVVQIAAGAGLYVLANKLYFILYPARDTIVICADTRRDMDIVRRFRQLRERYNICCVCYESEDYETILGHIDEYSTVILGNIDASLRTRLIAYCFESNKRLFITPTMEDIMLNNAHETHIGDSLAYLCKNRTFTMEQIAIKRVMDILVSFAGLVITLPVMIFTAIAIKANDGGKVFYKQKRLTRNGHAFMLIKFRSMIEQAETDCGACNALKQDDRITPVGRFIRAARIDELPQLIKILKGEMSLVGPRPERPEMYEKYCLIFPQFSYRLKVKAGLTGYAQIYGKYNTPFEDKVKMDLLYIENSSLLMDLRLLFYTIKVIFMKESSEGFDGKDSAHAQSVKNKGMEDS